ncbi:TauD/TfdA family dioxygenase [Nocardiopsis sp. ARC36]
MTTGPGGLAVVRAEAGQDVREWILARRGALLDTVARRGAVLVRGLGLAAASDVARAARPLLGEPVPAYEPFAGRVLEAPGVYSGADWSQEEDLCPHHEQTFRTSFPRLLAVGCLKAAESGGATLLADGAAVADGLPPPLVERFAGSGWTLVRNFGPGYVGIPWEQVYGSPDRGEVERYLLEQGIGYEWGARGALRTWRTADALIEHPLTGRRCWFNQAAFLNGHSMDRDVRRTLVAAYGFDGLPLDTRLGDGTPISAEWVEEINSAYRDHTFSVLLKEGDLLVIDNIRMAHGREAYSGTRNIAVTMGDPIFR